MNRGDTFVIPDYFGNHLNLILSVLKDSSLLIVHVTTRYKNSDTSCVLLPGEHRFIDRESIVRV